MNKFEIIKTAEVPVTHFAALFGFKRISVSMWVNGRSSPHHLYADKVDAALNKLQAAVDRGELPLKNATRGSRYNRVARILRIRAPATPN